MATYIGENKLKKLYIGDTKYKRIYIGDNCVWSGASEVTYKVKGVDTVIEVEEGQNCANRTITVSGATFLGWTTNSTSTTPMTTVIADGNPITLYAIYSYPNASLSGQIYRDWESHGFVTTTDTKSLLSIDGTKYSTIVVNGTIDIAVGMWASGCNASGYVGVTSGGSSNVANTSWRTGWSYPSFEGGTMTNLSLTVPNNSTNLYVTISGEWYGGGTVDYGDFSHKTAINITSVYGYGRTCTG